MPPGIGLLLRNLYNVGNQRKRNSIQALVNQ